MNPQHTSCSTSNRSGPHSKELPGLGSAPEAGLVLGLRARLAAAGAPLLALAICGASACHDANDETAVEVAMVSHWSHIAIDGSGLDHTPSNQGLPHVFGEQVGPCRAARAMAIVHVAVFEVANAIKPRYESYVGLAPAAADTSLRAAIGQAARDTLVALYPSQTAIFDGHLQADLAQVGGGGAKERGIALGQAAAQAILSMRANDGSDHPEPRVGIEYFPSDQPGKWRQDPITLHPLALGADWPQVTPFVMTAAEQFRVIPPPDLASDEYAFAYDEVRMLGGDGVTTPTIRDDEGTIIGIYWAYDGVPNLCAPPRLYNQIAVQIAQERGLDAFDLARMLALVNVAMADAGIAIWESKYFYEFWRPVTGIRESDPGTGPTGAGDGNDATVGDPNYTPLGAPASNTNGLNFTPPFPAYPSGHAGFGAALFQTLRRVLGTDEIEFTFVSDELNGVTVDNQGIVRELTPRTFTSLSQAEEENGQSRIYLGIHWRFDKTESITLGRNVGDFVFDNILQPLN